MGEEMGEERATTAPPCLRLDSKRQPPAPKATVEAPKGAVLEGGERGDLSRTGFQEAAFSSEATVEDEILERAPRPGAAPRCRQEALGGVPNSAIPPPPELP